MENQAVVRRLVAVTEVSVNVGAVVGQDTLIPGTWAAPGFRGAIGDEPGLRQYLLGGDVLMRDRCP